LGAVKQLGSIKYPKPEGATMTGGVTFESGNRTLAESIPPYSLRNGRSQDYFAHDD
jgi:hypothetical protein